MVTLNQPTEPLLPEVEPAPDALFGECGALDADSLFRRMLPESIKFFDLPLLDRLHRRHYHMVRLRGSFRLAKLVRDYRPQLLRSESCQNPRGRTCIERLMFDFGRRRLPEAARRRALIGERAPPETGILHGVQPIAAGDQSF